MTHAGNISLREIILRKKAELQDIENRLAAHATGWVLVKGRWARVSSLSRQNLIEKKAHLELEVSELEQEALLQAWRASSGDPGARALIEKQLADRGVTLRKPTTNTVAEQERDDRRLQAQCKQRATPVSPLAEHRTGPPEPISPVRGHSYRSSQPKPTMALDELPPSYPASLVAKTRVIVLEAVKNFPLQTQVVELCKLGCW